MRKILRAMKFVGGLFKKRQQAEFETGKGPYAGIDADDGTTWSIYKRSGKAYTY